MNSNLDHWYTTKYSIDSSLEAMENHRYCQKIKGGLYFRDESGDNVKHRIGKLTGKKILLDEADANGWNTYSIFDDSGDTFEIGKVLYDLEDPHNNYPEYNQNIELEFTNLIERNILILSKIEILPEYRGTGLGKKWIKDFYNNFNSGCGLVVLNAIPKQFYLYDVPEKGNLWRNKMKYSEMDRDEEKSTYKLLNYFLSIGFKHLPEISQDLVYLSPMDNNEKFNDIKIE
jgi:hypothetical protein